MCKGKMYKKREAIVKREIHGDFFLIDIKQNYLNEKCSLYELNPMGSYIWDALDCQSNINSIVQNIIDNTVEDIEFNEVYNDIQVFLTLLMQEGFVEYINGRDE